MVEVKITYETLFDLLRRERSRNELQTLEPTFYEDVKTYLEEKNNMLVDSNKKFTSRAEQEKIKIQIKNARKIIKELYETREKKILHLAQSKVKTGSLLLNTTTLLPSEKELFEEAIKLLNKYKDDMLLDILEKQDEFKYESSQESKAPSPDVSSSQNDSESEEPESNTVPPSINSDEVKIQLNTNLPKFVGLDQKIYGPYSKGDVLTLPSNVANLLISKGRAIEV